MKTLFIPALGALLILGACGKTESRVYDSVVTDNAEPVAEEKADTAVVNIPLEVKTYEKKKGENELKIAFPVSGNPGVVVAIRTWINETLGDSYVGNLEDGSALFRHYAAPLGEDPDLKEFGGFTKDEFELEFVNDYVVTYMHDSQIYEGGAHGMEVDTGTTFLQSDGSRFSRDCFKTYGPLRKYFIEGLKEYFKVQTNGELLNQLLGVKTLDQLPSPAIDPWIEENGVTFIYTQYEIAPYSAGAPRFTVPFEAVKPFLTEQGLKFIGE